MISFYNLSHEEALGEAKFVIKIDEIEIVKCRKLERASINLMNRALSKCTKENPSYFSVKSKIDIWWLGAFEVTHLILLLTLSSL